MNLAIEFKSILINPQHIEIFYNININYNITSIIYTFFHTHLVQATLTINWYNSLARGNLYTVAKKKS
jgi:hypothetical protein